MSAITNGWIQILLIMLSCGGLGGYAAWLLAPDVEGQDVGIRGGWKGYVAVGMIASIVVPLFLSMARSEMIADTGGINNLSEAFIFAGFCVVAGFSARAFMTTISEKVLNEMQRKVQDADQRTEQMQEEVDELRDNVRAEAPEPDPGLPDDETQTLIEALDATQKRVLRSTGTLTMRTASGIARDAEVPRTQVSKIVEDLIAKDLAERTTSPSTGDLRFKVTPKGVAVLNAIKK